MPPTLRLLINVTEWNNQKNFFNTNAIIEVQLLNPVLPSLWTEIPSSPFNFTDIRKSLQILGEYCMFVHVPNLSLMSYVCMQFTDLQVEWMMIDVGRGRANELMYNIMHTILYIILWIIALG